MDHQPHIMPPPLAKGGCRMRFKLMRHTVIPANAGIQAEVAGKGGECVTAQPWIPAFAGMTG